MKRGIYSDAFIIISFIIFFPLGFLLLYKRCAQSFNTGVLGFCGFILSFFGIMYLSAAFSGNLETSGEPNFLAITLIAVTIVCFLPAFMFFKKAIYVKKYRKIYLKYKNFFVMKKTCYISDISAATNIPTESVREDIKIILENGHFPDISLNDSTDKFVVSPKTYNNPYAATFIVNCPGCGAPNIITAGVEQNCEYCDALLDTTNNLKHAAK